MGNDFAVIDAISQRIRLNADQVRQLADRHCGIGFDQLLLVEPPTRPEMDFRYRIFNADGSEVEHCGNGARCFARFVRDKRLIMKERIAVETARGEALLTIRPDLQVEVDMGVITSYSIHYTKLYDALGQRGLQVLAPLQFAFGRQLLQRQPPGHRGFQDTRITSYNVCYTKLLRLSPVPQSSSVPG